MGLDLLHGLPAGRVKGAFLSVLHLDDASDPFAGNHEEDVGVACAGLGLYDPTGKVRD